MSKPLQAWDEVAGDARRQLEARARDALRSDDLDEVIEAVGWFRRYRRASDRGALVEVFHERGPALRGVHIPRTSWDLASELGRVAADRWAGIHMGLRLLLRQELLTEGRAGPVLDAMLRVDRDWVLAERVAIGKANPDVVPRLPI